MLKIVEWVTIALAAVALVAIVATTRLPWLEHQPPMPIPRPVASSLPMLADAQANCYAVLTPDARALTVERCEREGHHPVIMGRDRVECWAGEVGESELLWSLTAEVTPPLPEYGIAPIQDMDFHTVERVGR